MNTLGNVKWKNSNLSAIFLDKIYLKGVSLSDKEMEKLEAFLIRKPLLEKWDV